MVMKLFWHMSFPLTFDQLSSKRLIVNCFVSCRVYKYCVLQDECVYMLC